MNLKLISFFFFIGFLTVSCQEHSKKSHDNKESQELVMQTGTFYFIRHAEKQGGDDPELTPEGEKRAVRWADYFKNIKLDAVYSTDTKRTRATAQPVAEQKGLDITLYDAYNLDTQKLSKAWQGKNILIVGHSDTTPAVVNKIIGQEQYSQIDDNDFSQLFKVIIKEGDAHASKISVTN